MFILTALIVLHSLCETTCCISFAAYRSACAHIWVFAAVCHQPVWCWNSANLRQHFTNKNLSISPCLLRLSFNTTPQWTLKFKYVFKSILTYYSTWSSCSKPHRCMPVITTNMKNRAFLCTNINSLYSEFLVILQVRITLWSGSNTIHHPVLYFLFIPQQLDRLPCSFVKGF